MHSQVHGDRETLPTPPPTELLIRQCMPPASPSVKTSGLGSFGSSFDSSFTPGLLQDTSHLPSPRTPVRRKARRSLIAPLGGSSPLTSPPMSPLSGTGAISTPTSPSRRANTQNESISSSCDATLFYPAFVPSSQSFHLKTPRKAVGSARSYPVTGYSIEEPAPFMEPPASPLVAQKTFLEARSADSFSLGTSGPSAPRQRSSSIIPSSQSQELSSFFPPPREVATTRFTIGRSSRISPVRPDHSIVRVGSTGGHCAINEVCHTPDALRHHSHMHARQKSGQLDSSLLLKAVVSLPTTPGYPASRQGLEPRNFPHSVMLSSVDLVPTSQSQVEKDLILPHSNIHLAAADNSVPSGVGSSFSQKERCGAYL